jgi:hypothetical protein
MPADSEPSKIWIRVCAWCRMVLSGENQSQDPAVGSSMTTHGICPSCRDEFIRAVTAGRAATSPDGPPVGGAR